jgi:glycosyltransferase involved in cell wall biosynthesis
MIYPFKNPLWIDAILSQVKTLEDVPQSLFDEINTGLDYFQHPQPLVSVVIPAFNEEVSIIRTLYSLSKNKTSFPTEIIVVNNNSTDRTQYVLDRLHVRSFLQSKQGCGPARQLGQQMAKGKYVLMGDADCFYPERWIEKMTRELMRDNVTCVYGRYSFLGTEAKPRWQLFVYELLRDVIHEVRNVKRPYLNALGMSMGYIKDFGLKKGFVDRKIRGEDGRMCFELMSYGKVRRVRSYANSVWTLPRTLDKEGGLLYSIFARFALEVSRFKDYFVKQAAHDTHTSHNFDPKSIQYLNKFKDVHKQQEEPSKPKQKVKP